MKYSVNFYLEKRYVKNPEGKVPLTKDLRIFLFFSFEGQRMQFYTGHRIDSEKWEPALQRVRKNNVNMRGVTAAEINDELNKIDTAVVGIYKNAKAMDLEPNVRYIREQLKEKLIQDKIKTAPKTRDLPFLKEFDIYIDLAKVSHSPLYVKQLKSTKQHLENFSKEKHFPLSYSAINLTFFERFKSYFLTDLDNTDNSFASTIKRLKGFMKWASEHRSKGQNFEYLKFSATEKYNSPVVHLTWAEFQQLVNKKIDNDHMAMVRDLFVFQSMTGMRYDDMYNLKKENLKDKYIVYHQHKTKQFIKLPYNDFSLEIKNKYINSYLDRPLPRMSNQVFNRDLKKLFKFAKLNRQIEVIKVKGGVISREFKPLHKLATSHMARRNFIGISIEKKIQTEVIKAISGHIKDSKAFSRYYDINDDQKLKAMRAFKKK